MRPENSPARYQYDTRLHDYLLVVQPGDDVIEKILEEEQFFCEQYNHIHSSQFEPHIIIAHFLVKEVMEPTLVRWIQNICRLQNGFVVTLNNFGGFPPHAIYLRVQEPKPLIKLATAMKMIDSFIQSNDCPPIQITSRPHLAIAGNLPEHVYNKAIGDYAGKSFNASFGVDKLVLLKGKNGSDRYEMVNKFTLSQSPVHSD
jgi:hypothetical protein